jgi:DNA-directed RNA polymerase subunit M/transcription elongation factor TFIIS
MEGQIEDTLSEIDVTIDTYVYPEEEPYAYIISHTDPLSMKKSFPVTLGPYNFVNREQLILYSAAWLKGKYDEARKIAKAKKCPSKNFVLPLGIDWTLWIPTLAYIVAKKNEDKLKEHLLELGVVSIGASGRDTEWELGQDKATADRSGPPHHWGRNAWGMALTRLRKELSNENGEEENKGEDASLAAFLNEKLGKVTIKSKLSSMKIGKDSIWSNADARTEFLAMFRRTIRTHGDLNDIRSWIMSAKISYLDVFSFVSSLPSFKPVTDLSNRDISAKNLLAQNLNSIEKCKRCGSSVRLAEAQLRSADEPSDTLASCYNTETCATISKDEEIVPYTYKHRQNYRRLINVD